MKHFFFEFSNNVSIIACKGAVEMGAKKLHDLGGYRIFIVTDADMIKTPIMKKIQDIITKENELAIGKIYSDLVGPVTVADVDKVYEAYRKSGCDCILAIGGTRAAFASKSLCLLLSTNSRNILDFTGIDCAIRKRTIPFGVIPTTFGTGVEVSSGALVIDNKTKLTHEFVSDFLQPSFCVLDPLMLDKFSEEEIFLSVIDTIAYDIEAYISLRSNAITKSFAKMSMFMIKNAFQKVAVEHDKEALFDMQRAATLTAISYSNTFSGLIHSVAHTLTAKYGIYHSKAVASILVACLEFYKDACEKEYSQMLLFSLGAKEYSTLDAKERCDVFITLFRNLINFISSSGSKVRLSEYGIKEEELDEIADTALLDGVMITTPKSPTKEDIIQILKESL